MSTTEITRFSMQGKGFTRLGDKNFFFKNTVPGDVVVFPDDYHQIPQKNVDVKEFQIIQPSWRRVEPRCPQFAHCGGCTLLHVSYSDQLAWKAESCRHQIKRLLAGKVDERVFSFVPAPQSFYYRERAALHLKGSPSGPILGFYGKGGKELLRVEHCTLLSQTLNHFVFQLTEKLKSYSSCFPEITLELQELPAMSMAGEKCLFVVFHPDRKKMAEENIDLNALIEWLHSLPEIAWAGWARDAWKSDAFLHSRDERGRQYYALPKHFMQVNSEVNRALRNFVAEVIKLTAPKKILDLYAGNGNLSLQLSDSACEEATLVELNQNAIRALEAGLVQIESVNFYAINRDVIEFFEEIRDTADQNTLDLVIIDPPREGVRRVLKEVIQLQSRNIVFVSCDSASFFHSVSLLIKKGYRIERIRAFDMFPQTPHLEFAVWACSGN